MRQLAAVTDEELAGDIRAAARRVAEVAGAVELPGAVTALVSQMSRAVDDVPLPGTWSELYAAVGPVLGAWLPDGVGERAGEWRAAVAELRKVTMSRPMLVWDSRKIVARLGPATGSAG